MGIAGKSLFVGRLQHREETNGARGGPERIWRTEITVERDEVSAWIATRVWFSGAWSEGRRCAPPRFIKQLWVDEELVDVDVLQAVRRRLEYAAEADVVGDLILSKGRNLPVVVIADGCPLDANRIATDSVGLAHVVNLGSQEVRMRLMTVLGGEYELGHGSIGTFYPRVKEALPVAPAARFETVVAWRWNGLVGPAAFAGWLHEEMGRATVLRLLNDAAHRTLEGVKAEALEAKRIVAIESPVSIEGLRLALDDANVLVMLLEAENGELRKQMTELTDRAERWRGENASLEEQLRVEIRRNAGLQKEKASLLYALSAKNGSGKIEVSAVDVEDLIRQQPDQATVFDAVSEAKSLFALYGANVVVSEKALESAMDSPFVRPNDILAALLRLGFLWNEIREGEGATLSDRAREKIGYWCALRDSDPAMERYGSERRFRHEGQEVVLEKHLTLGGGKQNDATTAQIYFGDRDGQVIIGHVGRHLTTIKTQ